MGEVRTYTVKNDESLIEIARGFDLGYNHIVDANPGIDPFVPGNGKVISIPAAWIMPDIPPLFKGIVVNLPEMRLYSIYSKNGEPRVKTFPIGIGRESNPTPEGKLTVIEKIENPVWHVPESIKKEKPYLPDEVLPGPDNPLGSHALRLSRSNYLIHGTNKPWGIGRKYSHGCIRLYPEDIPELFELVQTGTPVIIVNQPVKIGLKGGEVYMEVHKGRTAKTLDYLKYAFMLLRKKDLLKTISTDKVYKAVSEKTGAPVNISR